MRGRSRSSSDWLFNPVLLKKKTRIVVFKVLGSMFLIGFLMVAVGHLLRDTTTLVDVACADVN